MSVIQPAPEPGSIQPSHSCLFLDIDGTLAELQPHPDDVRIDPELIGLLGTLHGKLGGALALISGRPLTQIDALFSPLRLPAAGIHGYERRSHGDMIHRPAVGRQLLEQACAALTKVVEGLEGLYVEDKGAAIALHYRGAPAAADLAMEMMQACARRTGDEFELLEGNHVIELKPAVLNKATAIEAFLNESPFAGRTPIYIGDDRTDFDGFGAVRRHGGLDIAVGDRVQARWRFDNPAAVRAWLQGLVTQPGSAST